jgi:hypothetical protein
VQNASVSPLACLKSSGYWVHFPGG